MSGAKKNVVAIIEATETVAPVEIPGMIEIPAKICVQIGLRKRYFSTRDEALAALTEFNERANKVHTGPSRNVLTKEQRAQRDANRAVLMTYAELQGKAGKNISAMANVLEDLVAQIPAVFALIAEYNTTPRVELTGTTEQSETVVQAGETVDPLADFGM